MLTGIDVSHHQGTVNWSNVRGGGSSFAVIKATEGVGYTDPTLSANRSGARGAGLVVGLYHFAKAGDPAAEAAYFAQAVGKLQVGEFVVLDWETSAADPVGWCLRWLQAVQAALGVKPLIYLNGSTMTGFNWAPVVAADYGLWLAKYDGLVTAPAVTCWPAAAMKQYSDAGKVPGIVGGVDLDVFYGDAAALLAYGAQSSTPAAPTPKPEVKPAPAPAPFDVRNWRASAGATGQVFVNLQKFANRVFPGYASTPIAPTAAVYGPATVKFLAEFCKRSGITSDGKDIGPRTAVALYAAGFRG